ncbi:MAG: collagen binding domain-containing protein [Blastocatellia bacterium]
MLKHISCLLALNLLLTPATFAQTPGTASVSGRVTLKGEPVSGVSVGLQPQLKYGLPDSSKLQRTRTDAEGRFRLTGLDAGQYLIAALSPGLIAPSDSPYGQQGKALSLAAGETVENMEIQLKRGGVIAGRITDAHGNSIVEISVKLSKLEASGKFVSYSTVETANYAYTDDRGVYRLFALPAGKYKVSVGEPQLQPGGLQPNRAGGYYAQTFYPGTTNEAQAKIIDVGEGSEATDVNIKVGGAKEVFDVAGRVIDTETGQPLSNVMVGFGTSAEGGGLMAYATNDIQTDAKGEYEFRGLMPGRYSAFLSSQANKASEHYSETVPFEVSDSNVSGLEIKAIRGGSITGRAVVEDSGDKTIQAKFSQLTLIGFSMSSQGAPAGRSVKIAADGSFRMGGLQPGNVSINVSPLPGIMLLRIEHNGAPIKDNIPIQQGEQVKDVRLVFGAATATLRGQLKFVGGAPPAGVTFRITATRVDGTAAGRGNGSVDARGQFVVPDLAGGEYIVRVFLMLTSTPTPEMMEWMKALRNYTHNVTVAASGETQIELVVDLSKKENDK